MKTLLLLIGIFVSSMVLAAPPQVALSWTAPTTNTDGSALSATLTYNVYQGATCTSLAKVQSGITVSSATITAGLIPGTTPCFAITAVSSGAESAQSNAVTSSTPIPLPTPNPPTSITIVIQ